MDPLGHSTLPILRVEIYASLASIRIKYATASLDADHLILAVAISAEDKKLQKRSVGLVVSKKKIGDDPLQVIRWHSYIERNPRAVQ